MCGYGLVGTTGVPVFITMFVVTDWSVRVLYWVGSTVNVTAAGTDY